MQHDRWGTPAGTSR